MDWWGTSGGICKLRELIEEHPAELAYDLRKLLNLSIFDLGSTISYGESVLLVAMLMREPESWLQAVSNGWDYPVSREWIVTSHLYDLFAMANSGKGKKPKPYPNPFPDRNKDSTGRTDLSPVEAKALLARMNSKEP